MVAPFTAGIALMRSNDMTAICHDRAVYLHRRADTAEQQSREAEQGLQEGRQTIHHLQAQLQALTADLQHAKQERSSVEAHFQVSCGCDCKHELHIGRQYDGRQ